MILNSWEPKEVPKNRKAALNLAVHVLQLADSTERRRNNIMTLISEHEKKIATLQEKLDKLSKELDRSSSDPSRAKEYVENLKTQWSLTEAEILEVKSALLRKSIEERQRALEESMSRSNAGTSESSGSPKTPK